MTSNFDPDLKIGIIFARFIKSGKTPFLKERLNTLTRSGTIIGAAILRGLIGTSVGPGDLVSSSRNSIVITCGIEVFLKEKLF